MPVERSAGAVLFWRDPAGGPLYLLLQHSLGHWDFPKGKIEKGESTEETIRREIQEETGVNDVEFIPGFKETIHYFYYPRKSATERKRGQHSYQWEGEKRNKWVVYLLAETRQDEVKISFEHKGFAWLSFDEAQSTITFDNSREVLRKAHSFLLKKP